MQRGGEGVCSAASAMGGAWDSVWEADVVVCLGGRRWPAVWLLVAGCSARVHGPGTRESTASTSFAAMGAFARSRQLRNLAWTAAHRGLIVAGLPIDFMPR